MMEQDRIDKLIELSDALIREGCPDKALERAREACNIARLHYGEDNPEYAACLNNLVYIHHL